MWYNILVDNEFADYLMREEACLASNKEKTAQILTEYADIVRGVTYVWAFRDSEKIEDICRIIERQGGNIHRGFEFCHKHISLTATQHLFEVANSLKEQFDTPWYDIDATLLNAEQCAYLLMYPFWSRMDGSFEKEFQERGQLRYYLCALQSKCEKQ